MPNPLISFIIPTHNEEAFIGRILNQFEQIDDSIEFEVIVSDACSNDKTREIARNAGVIVTLEEGGKTTISAGRNNGAKIAKGELLIFCDADTRLEDVNRFLKKVLLLFKDKKVVAAMPRIAVFPSERIWSDNIFHFFYNKAIELSFRFWPTYSSGQCQVIRHTAFEAVGGYPKNRIHAEDSAIFRKLRVRGKLIFISDEIIFESPRRYRHYGYIIYLLRSFASLLAYDLFKRNILKDWRRID